MKIKIISVGKIKDKSTRILEADYTKRIARYARMEHLFVKDAPFESIKNEEKVRQTEANEISSRINPGEFVVALDRCGKEMSSESFAEFLSVKMLRRMTKITFVVGGPLGLLDAFFQQADFVLSFSKMTFPHELAKVFLLEQIYRAFTIINGEKYHK